MERPDIRAADPRVRRIIARILAGGIGIRPLESCIVAAKDLVLIAKQLFAESRGGDAEICGDLRP